MEGNWLEIIVFSVAIPLISRFLLNPLIKSTKRKNQAIEWFKIAEGIVALLIIANPTWNKEEIINRAMDCLLEKIKGIDPETAKRIVTNAYVTVKSANAKVN